MEHGRHRPVLRLQRFDELGHPIRGRLSGGVERALHVGRLAAAEHVHGGRALDHVVLELAQVASRPVVGAGHPLPPQVKGVVEERAHLGTTLRLLHRVAGRGRAIAAHRRGAELRDRLRHHQVVRPGEQSEDVVGVVGEERIGLRVRGLTREDRRHRGRW